MEKIPVEIRVKVKTNKNHNKVIDQPDEPLFYIIETTATPERGKANKKVIEMLALYFDVPKVSVEIIKGKRSKLKTIIIHKDSLHSRLRSSTPVRGKTDWFKGLGN